MLDLLRLKKVVYCAASFWLASLGVLLLLPSLAVTAIVPFWRHGASADMFFWWSAVGYAGGVFLAFYAVHWLSQCMAGRQLAAAIVLAVFLLRVLLVILFQNYQQREDCGYFLDFVCKMIPRGDSNTTVWEELSAIWDYQLWIGRAFPFYALFEAVFGPRSIMPAQLLNAACMTGVLAFTYGITLKTLGARAALWTVMILAVAPIHSWLILDYSHQPQGAFWFAVAVWLMLDLARQRNRFAKWKSAAFGLAWFLLFLQRGLDMLLLGALLLWLVLLGLHPARQAAWPRRLLLLLVIPCLVYVPARMGFTHFSQAFNVKQTGSGLGSLMVHGWSQFSGGEHYPPYENLDKATPVAEKREAMLRIMISRIVYEPWQSLGTLMVEKIAKYFLVGYASGVEQRLAESGYARAADCFKAMRLVYAPALLLLAMCGGLRLLRRARINRSLAWLVGIILLAVFFFAMLGQASPRYSFYVQFLLAMLAGAGLSAGGSGESWRVAARRCLGGGGAGLAAYGIAGALLVLILRQAFMAYTFVDMRQAVCHGADASGRSITQSRGCLEHELSFVAAQGPLGQAGAACEWRFDCPAAGNRCAFMLIFSAGQVVDPSRLQCEIWLDGACREALNFGPYPYVLRREYVLPQAGTHRLALRLVHQDETPVVWTGSPAYVRIGFLGVWK